jgi:hypothetical protein
MTRWMHSPLPFLLAALAACTVGPNTSYVAQLQQPADVDVLANGMAEFVSMRLPAASSTVVLDPTPSGQSGNAFTAAFASALRRSGFAVAEDGQPEPAVAHHVRYLVTPLDNGDLARLTIDDSMEGSRFFCATPPVGYRPVAPSK